MSGSDFAWFFLLDGRGEFGFESEDSRSVEVSSGRDLEVAFLEPEPVVEVGARFFGTAALAPEDAAPAGFLVLAFWSLSTFSAAALAGAGRVGLAEDLASRLDGAAFLEDLDLDLAGALAVLDACARVAVVLADLDGLLSAATAPGDGFLATTVAAFLGRWLLPLLPLGLAARDGELAAGEGLRGGFFLGAACCCPRAGLDPPPLAPMAQHGVMAAGHESGARSDMGLAER